MLINIIGSVIVGLLIAGSVFLCYSASLTVPPRDLRRRWRSRVQ